MRNGSFNTETYHFINYSEMSEDDSREIFDLRNHHDVSRWMVNDQEISWDVHKRFVNSLRSRIDKDYFIVKDNDGMIVGSVNIDYSENGISERGIFIAPNRHHKGHAFCVLKEFYSHVKLYFSVSTILTKVKSDNVASLRLEEKLGSKFSKEYDGYKTFILKL